MRKLVAVLAVLLVLYSTAVMSVELRRGATAVHAYLDDPPARIPFAHIHTSLSAGLLGACALLFAVSRRVERVAGRGNPADVFFLNSQAVLLLVLAADERFRLGPRAASALGVPEDALYVALGALEAALLLGPGRLCAVPRRPRAAALLAGACYGLSLALDRAPAWGPVRWSAEELPKVWGGALFFLFAWARLEGALDALVLPGLDGHAWSWARDAGNRNRRRGRSAAEVPAASRRADRPAWPGPAGRDAAPQRSRASTRRADAPEPDPKLVVSGASAAPPRKLLSH